MKKTVLRSTFYVLCSWVAIPFLFANPSKSPAATPMKAVRDLDDMVDKYRVGKKLSKNDEEYNRKLKSEILRGTFNLHELARLALGKHWNKLGVKEQNRFSELLTRILEERSVFAKEKAAEKGEARSYKIEYKKEKFLNAGKTQGFVHTTVQLKKHRTKLDIDYKLRKSPHGVWQIYDVIVDEASLVDNYRASFGRIIEKNGYPELVRRMESKLKEFRSKRG